jgi:hypothetical protein
MLGKRKVVDRLLLNGQENLTQWQGMVEHGLSHGDRPDCQPEAILMELTPHLEEHGAHWTYAANGPDVSAD